MSERGCIKCGYNLAGLPAAGTVVTCPECGLANDLSVPLLVRVSTFAPYLCGLVPAALVPVAYRACVWVGLVSRGPGPDNTVVIGVLAGALTAGAAMYWMIGREPKNGYTPRPLWARLALSVCAAFASVFINALLLGTIGALIS